MNPPTLKELIAQATPGPASRTCEKHFTSGLLRTSAKSKLAARLSPDVALAVYEALEHSANLFEHLKNHSWTDEERQPHIEQLKECRAALRLLDGTEDAK